MKLTVVQALKIVKKQGRNELLSCLRITLDISYAVSYLPLGVLWGGKLNTWQVGALGTLSSLIGLYQAIKQTHRKQMFIIN